MSGPTGPEATLAAVVPGDQLAPGANPYTITGNAWNPNPVLGIVAFQVMEPDLPEDPVIPGSKTGLWDTPIPIANTPQSFGISFQGTNGPYTVAFTINGATSAEVTTFPFPATITAGAPEIVVSPIQFTKIVAIV